MDVLVQDRPNGPGLAVNRVIARMTEAEASDLRRVLRDTSIPATAIADVLNDHGFQISTQAITRYRRIIKEERITRSSAQTPRT